MQDVHQKAKRGIRVLLGRQVILQVVTFSTGIVLARVLGPANVGLYVISTFVVGLFAMIGDFGLAPSLIQRKGDLTPRDVQIAFTLQQMVTSVIVPLILFTAGPVARLLYPNIAAVEWLVRAMAVNLYLSSWRTMSALQLEREMKFDRLARVEIIETVVFQLLAVGCAVAGFGAWSYVIAVLSTGLVGTGLMYAAAPWRVRLAFDRREMVRLLRFSVPFQLQMILNAVGGWVTPLVVGRVVGPDGVGYLTWASSNGRKPLMLIDVIMRVGFAHFSRIQDDRAEVEKTVVRYLGIALLAAGFWCAGILVNAHGFVEWVYQAKWLPGVSALILYSFIVPLDMLCGVLTVALNGIGRVGVASWGIGLRSALSVGLSVLLVYFSRGTSQAYLAVPLGYMVASLLTVPWMISGVRPGAAGRVLRELAWVLVPVSVAIIIGWGTLSAVRAWPLPARVMVTGLALTFAYATAAYPVAPGWMRESVRRWTAGLVAARRRRPVMVNPAEL